ncbi:acetyltransferase [Owenweeksia hongkongensis DSM 17368]|uniref:Acetyltransferase n=1 Tax=Owenweeksia hongkongensis (strain DSM 17368 / CIP 108786 / JCM 12287 / NRRL B-23963 / UST20020801) TaxID=926562 RepID=G8R5V2_OWEHD|nr:GNAT family N-acetyltransferase [Owenweeksia hongkongensis]AEV31100.1 acetyltransferase [Owenweeksia hongkongensis DSM 17368]
METEFVRNNNHLIKQVVNLGTKNSKTLGHFPEGAYFEHAHKEYLICSHVEGNLLGYLLFSVTKSKRSIRIIQLCISEEARGQGVSKKLLDFLKSKFRGSLKGIALSCRTDYKQASALWESYGFKAMDKVRSRSKKEYWLYKWWYDFGNHDLFSFTQISSSKHKVILDANIIIKLRSNSVNQVSGALFLLEDWLVDVVDYYYSPEIYNEIKRDKGDERAKKTRSFLTNFNEAKFNPDYRDEVFDQINNILFGTSPNDISDKKQLSECIASGIQYFITEDKGILNASDRILELFGTHILRPIDIILLVDESSNKADYVATRIAGVNYDYSSLKSGEVDELLEKILAKDQCERKHELREIFTRSASNVKNCSARVIRDKNKAIHGVLICESKPQEVTVPLIRTTKSKLAKTLFSQLVFETIDFAVSNQKDLVTICDKYIDSVDQETLESMGFTLKDDLWMKVTARGIINSSELLKISGVKNVFDEETLKIKLQEPQFNEFRISLERKLWPLKFNNVDLPTYIIPIKPHWASQLFDHYAANELMFGADAFLAWSRENVYYRSVNPVSEKVPARLLWYASSTRDRGATRVNSVVACSYLDEVYVGKAKELFHKLKHFGIYEWKNIFHLAQGNDDGLVKALRFRDTEVFKTAVSFENVNHVLKANNRKRNTFASPLEVSNDVFLEIYKLGGIL